ncbi:hypothetical protein TNCV_1027961 [Trichonephila clavipes]|nr:hypothetical protein TNCV_1027961 [Trichonephila clavipes]
MSPRGPQNSSRQRARFTAMICRSFEHHTSGSMIWLSSTSELSENTLKGDQRFPSHFSLHQPLERTCG